MQTAQQTNKPASLSILAAQLAEAVLFCNQYPAGSVAWKHARRFNRCNRLAEFIRAGRANGSNQTRAFERMICRKLRASLKTAR